jgi:Na+-transporting NADH:ubiquinone oxidoreductase subunit A
MRLANIRFGPRIRAVGGPVGRLTLPRSVALLGSDYPDLRLDLRVQEGDRVATGEVLFSNRKHPEVVFVAPSRGQVKKINLGPGRRLSALVLDLEPDEAPGGTAPPTVQTGGDIRHLLLSRGLWPAFRSRPFGRIPAPDEQPEAIFVHAMAGYDGAPDPATLLAECNELFGKGLNALTGLTDGPVLACIPESLTLPLPEKDRVRITHFPPRRQSSMATYHIARLHGPTHGRPVWSIGWQDVVAIGHLLMTGHYQGDRIVALQASPAATPVLSRTILGASLPDLFGGHPAGSEISVSGPVIGDKQAHWLGRYDTQAARIVERGGSFIHRVFGRPGSTPRAILPHAALDACLPPGIPVVPFLRALAAGDIDGVERLGGRDMIEEDLIHAQYLCTSGTDYGARLRQMLNMMDAAG